MSDLKVSDSALVKRINRKLAKDWGLNKVLRKNRGWQMKSNFGDYCLFNYINNYVVKSFIDVGSLAKDLNVL
jgi:hypothetical protein